MKELEPNGESESPFLEITLMELNDQNDSDANYLDILDRLRQNFLQYYGLDPSSIKICGNNQMLVNFLEKTEFNRVYDQDYAVYQYLYENILQNDLLGNLNEIRMQKDLKTRENLKLSHSSAMKSDPNTVHADLKNLNNLDDLDELSQKNYAVIRYRSNFLEPLRRNYNLISKVNEYLGSNVYNEEISDGFLRFVKNKEDFDAMLLAADEVEAWKEWFKLYEYDLDNPIIVQFLEIVQKKFR
ncbi:MAG: hypothetical protein E4G98_03380 [Promethearchaeota archaeon]|nr:MAG: hypothetical protein E4G98_03380 [Candidatus Lokiarchaeota archaeon]